MQFGFAAFPRPRRWRVRESPSSSTGNRQRGGTACRRARQFLVVGGLAVGSLVSRLFLARRREMKPGASALRGVLFSLLALGQLLFVFVFAYRFYIVSQSDWATLDSRWIFPPIALISFSVFAFEAWKAVVPKKP